MPLISWQEALVGRSERWGALGLNGSTVWFTGLSGSGKSSTAVIVERALLAERRPVLRLDGDNLRHGLCSDLGFSREDRDENVRRVGEVALLAADSGMVALTCLVSPYAAAREAVRQRHEASGLRFIEVFMDASLEECEGRDPKGLYARARSGQLRGLTGVDDPWEPPLRADLTLRSEHFPSARASAEAVLEFLRSSGALARGD